MKETGIIFTGELIPKVIDGSKTMTRRTWGLKEINESPNDWEVIDVYVTSHPTDAVYYVFRNHKLLKEMSIKCPYGQVGDLLWVRETWRETGSLMRTDNKIPECGNSEQVVYKADADYDGPFRSPLHMPRWASRANLINRTIKIERLQEITEKDALLEGSYLRNDKPYTHMPSARLGFQELWNWLNKKRGYSWARNPFCWVIEFKRLHNEKKKI